MKVRICEKCGRKHRCHVTRGRVAAPAKLTEASVRSIRRAAAKDVSRGVAKGVTTASLARRFGVSQSAIKEIVLGWTWRHVK